MSIPAAATPYVVAFVLAALASYWLAFRVGRRYDADGTSAFVAVSLVVGAFASVSAAHVLFGDSRIVTRVAVTFELTFATLASVLWFVFAGTYASRRVHERAAVRVALGGLVAVTFVLAATSPLHGFVYPELVPAATPFAHYAVVKGPGHYLLATLAYVPFLAGVAVMVSLLRSTPYLSRAVAAITLGAVALAAANLLPYLVAVPIDYNPLYMPLGATVFVLFAALAVRYNLFTVTPVARQNVVTAIRDPIVTLDTAGRVVDVNPAFTGTFVDGATNDVVGEPFDAVAPRLADAVSLEEHGEPQRVTLDGADVRHYTVTVSPVATGPHRLGHTLVFRDVTATVRSRQELERQNAQLDEFAVSAAHNLRNPLAIVTGFTDVLESHLHAVEAGDADYDEALVARCLGRLHRENDRIDDIVTDFLRVIRDGKTVTSVEPVAFRAALVHALNGLDDPHSVDLTVDRDGAVHADPARFVVLLRAVLRSARDRAGGPVAVTARVTDDGFVVEDDSGPVSAADCEMLLEHGHSTKYRTTGLGLTVARTLAAVHRWDIDAEPGDAGLRIAVTGAATERTDERPDDAGWVTPPAK